LTGVSPLLIVQPYSIAIDDFSGWGISPLSYKSEDDASNYQKHKDEKDCEENGFGCEHITYRDWELNRGRHSTSVKDRYVILFSRRRVLSRLTKRSFDGGQPVRRLVRGRVVLTRYPAPRLGR